jgi:membrane-anchored glycerophosphoryl diester phosphodiesterase (GDPDase)
MDIGRVFSTSFAMLRQRFWPLLGMWAVFFVIQIVAMFALILAIAGMGIAGSAKLSAGIGDPAALAGLGIGMIIFMVAFYACYIVLILAQQAAMVTLASPLEETSFGGALSRGFKSALPFLGIAVLFLLGYIAVVIGLAAVAGGVALADDTAGGLAGGLLALLFLPVLIYLACRFSVLVGVVAVDQVFNPIAAIRRSWSVTGGKVLSILLAILGFMAISAVIVGLPFMLLFSAAASSGTDAAISFGVVASVLLVFLLIIVYTMFASAFSSALHAIVTGGGADRLEEVFA